MILDTRSDRALLAPLLLATIMLGGCTNAPAFLRPTPQQAPIAYNPYYCYQTLAYVECNSEQNPDMQGQLISNTLQPTLMRRTQPYANGPTPDEVAAAAAAKQAKEDKKAAAADQAAAENSPVPQPLGQTPGPDSQPQPETLAPAMTAPVPPGLCPCGPAMTPAPVTPSSSAVETSPVPLTDGH